MDRKCFLLCAQKYAHAQRTPLFWMVHSNQVIDSAVNFVLQETWKLAVEMVAFWFIFRTFKGINLQNMTSEGWSINDVWMPSGIHNRLSPKSHSRTPNWLFEWKITTPMRVAFLSLGLSYRLSMGLPTQVHRSRSMGSMWTSHSQVHIMPTPRHWSV